MQTYLTYPTVFHMYQFILRSNLLQYIMNINESENDLQEK